MSVLYKGLKMPKSCSVCREIYYVPDSVKGTSVRCGIDNKLIHQYSKTVYDIESGFPYKTNRPDWCPLGDVPAPHGRLIDADKLHEATYHRAFETDGDTTWQSGCWVRYRAIEQVQDSQPTIVEAEEVE